MDLQKLVSHPELPSIPEAILKLNELIKNQAPIDDMAAVISNEPSLTARTLELANSAWYKRQREIATVHDAIAIIGMAALHQLIFASSVIRTFSGIDNKLVDMKTYWRQSVRTATAAQTLAHKTKINEPLELFTAGLLLYIGKLILYIAAPEITERVLKKVRDTQQPQFIVENETLGYNHSEVSAELLKRWHLPDIYDAIQFYTNPDKATEQHRNRACTLNLAHNMQYVHDMKIAVTDPPGKVSVSALKKLNINEMDLSEYAELAESLYDEAVAMLGL